MIVGISNSFTAFTIQRAMQSLGIGTINLWENTSKTSEVDLIFFTGGEDINPILYNEVNTASHYNPTRDQIEVEIFHRGENKRKIGFCRGHQLLNALTGGKLIQDIYPEHDGCHTVENILQEERVPSLVKYISQMSSVNSLHHQGYDLPKISPYLKPIIKFQDIIEASYGENIISTQYHPELMDDQIFWQLVVVWMKEK
jgi:putative glutamine amidotransferase